MSIWELSKLVIIFIRYCKYGYFLESIHIKINANFLYFGSKHPYYGQGADRIRGFWNTHWLSDHLPGS